MPTRRRLVAACALFGAVAGFRPAWAQNDERPQELEQQVKAAFLYKFGGYVTWPQGAFAQPDSPIVIGVAGADPLAFELVRMVAGRTIDKRPVAVRRVRRGDSLDGLHILFIGSEWRGDLLKLVQGRPVLSVTENDPGSTQESAVNFVVENNRVRFDISLEAAQKNGLKLSALLLSAARQVRGREP
jgi:hypothetical protein